MGTPSDQYQEDCKSRLCREKIYFSQIFDPELRRVKENQRAVRRQDVWLDQGLIGNGPTKRVWEFIEA